MPSNNLYTVADVARLTGLEESTIRRYAASHGIGTCYSGKVRLFTKQDLKRMQNRNRPGRPQKQIHLKPDEILCPKDSMPEY